jgi:hypothetical protein
MRRLALGCACAVWLLAYPAAAQLRVGVAQVDVTPPAGSRMYGCGARGTDVSTGVHDPLYAKAIVISDGRTTLGWVTMDLGYVDTPFTRAVRSAVADRVGADIDEVLLSSSHTHSGPTFSPDFPSVVSPWIDQVVEMIADTVVEAYEGLEPARLGVGWGEVSIGHNRRRVLPDGSVEMFWENREGLPTSPVDLSLAVVSFDSLSGDPIATLINMACHPVVLGPDNLDYSADYPGAMMTRVEAEVGGQAMFLQGAAGDINPFWDKTPQADGAYLQIQRIGELVATEVIRVRNEATVSLDADWLSFNRELVGQAPRWDIDDPEIRAAVRADYLERFERERVAEVNTLLIGPDLALATFPGEFFVEHGLRLKRDSLVKNTIFVGYSNGHLGYFPTIRAAGEGGYGADSSTIVAVGAGERLVSRALVNLSYQAGRLSPLP